MSSLPRLSPTVASRRFATSVRIAKMADVAAVAVGRRSPLVCPHRELRCNVLVTHIVPQLFDANNGLLGGAERYALELARHMAERVPTRLVTFGRTETIRVVGKLEIRVIRPVFRLQGRASNPFSIRALSIPWSSDIIHVHQSHLLLSEVLAGIGRLIGRPSLYDGSWRRRSPSSQSLARSGLVLRPSSYQSIQSISLWPYQQFASSGYSRGRGPRPV